MTPANPNTLAGCLRLKMLAKLRRQSQLEWFARWRRSPVQAKAQNQKCCYTRWPVLILAAIILVGCKSSSPAPYVSPKVTGRVLDAQTHQPIKGVKVQRLIPDQQPNVLNDVKGGQVMAGAPAVRTAADGTFELASERSLSPFQRGGWYSVSVAFEHAEYTRYVTNFSLKHSVMTPKGEPVVNAGDIWLARKSP